MVPRSRRRFLSTVGTAATVSVAGCGIADSVNVSGDGWSSTADGATEPLPAESDGWPQYGRNSRHTGFAPAVRLDDPNVDWTFERSGAIALPAIVGDRVIVYGSVESESGGGGDDGGAVFSLRAEDGTRRWRRELPGSSSGVSGSPPVVHRGSVYVGHVGRSGLYALDARDGSPRWRHRTAASINEAALGFQDRVFATTGDELLAFDLRGRRQWTYSTGDDRSSFSPAGFGGGYVLYTTSIIGSVVAIDPSAGGGVSEWRYLADTPFGTPTASNGTAYVPGRDRIHAVEVANGERVWTKAVNPSSGPSTDGDRLFVTTESGDLVAYATADGSEQWRTTLADGDGERLETRPLLTDRSVVVTTEKPRQDERVTTYALDRRSGEQRWEIDQPGNRAIGGAVAAGGRVYVLVYWSTDDDTKTLVALSD